MEGNQKFTHIRPMRKMKPGMIQGVETLLFLLLQSVDVIGGLVL
jgi:hypothetical protein